MGDMGDMYRDWRDSKKANKRNTGVKCPGCAIARPKAHPTILLPRQRCRVCGYVDPRGGTDKESVEETK